MSPLFTFEPQGSNAPQQKIGLGLVEAGETYEFEGDQADQAATDPDFKAASPAAEPTKDQLLEQADKLGIQVPSRATKAAIQQLIDDYDAAAAADAEAAAAAEGAAAAAVGETVAHGGDTASAPASPDPED